MRRGSRFATVRRLSIKWRNQDAENNGNFITSAELGYYPVHVIPSYKCLFINQARYKSGIIKAVL